VNTILLGLDSFRSALSVGFFAIGIVLAVVCSVDWLVRTRRLNPFGAVAQFFRQSVEPLMKPIEQQIVRAGGVPTSAPWWALAVAVLGGIIFLSLFDFVRGQLLAFHLASQTGSRGLLRIFISWTFAVLQIALLVRVISSWVRVSPFSRWVRWAFVLSEPILRPLRQVVPTIGMIDITPIVAYFLLRLLESFLLRLA